MTTETLLGERKSESDKIRQRLKLVTAECSELKAKQVCVWICCEICTHAFVPIYNSRTSLYQL